MEGIVDSTRPVNWFTSVNGVVVQIEKSASSVGLNQYYTTQLFVHKENK